MSWQNPTHGPTVAAAVAGAIVLIGGLTFRLLATPPCKTPIDSEALQAFPTHIGDWTGVDIPLDDDVVRATNTDSHINRRYSHGGNLGSIVVYIACGARGDKVAGHYPRICYAAAGWIPVSHRLTDLPVPDGKSLSCTVFQFVRGGLKVESVTVLHYFISDGICFGDLSLLGSRIWPRMAGVPYLGQVQIVASTDTSSDDSAVESVRVFAMDSAQSVAELFEQVKMDRKPRKSLHEPPVRR